MWCSFYDLRIERNVIVKPHIIKVKGKEKIYDLGFTNYDLRNVQFSLVPYGNTESSIPVLSCYPV